MMPRLFDKSQCPLIIYGQVCGRFIECPRKYFTAKEKGIVYVFRAMDTVHVIVSIVSILAFMDKLMDKRKNHGNITASSD